jgi:pimeloyl-ACP methyl ester carboxylesterase
MPLYAKTYGEGPALIIMHGLFGSADNWHPIAMELGKNFQVFALDLRNHGRSFHSPEMSYASMTADLLEFMNRRNLASAHLLGHSMGGKAAMAFALHEPARVGKLLVADIAPRAYPEHHGPIFAALDQVDLGQVRSRRDADGMLSETIREKPLRQFLLKNLLRNPDGSYSWKFNLPALRRHYGDILAATAGPGRFAGPTLFIRGELSDYIRDAELPQLRELFPNALCADIPGAGHWVHADNQPCFLQTVRDFLSD